MRLPTLGGSGRGGARAVRGIRTRRPARAASASHANGRVGERCEAGLGNLAAALFATAITPFVEAQQGRVDLIERLGRAAQQIHHHFLVGRLAGEIRGVQRDGARVVAVSVQRGFGHVRALSLICARTPAAAAATVPWWRRLRLGTMPIAVCVATASGVIVIGKLFFPPAGSPLLRARRYRPNHDFLLSSLIFSLTGPTIPS